MPVDETLDVDGMLEIIKGTKDAKPEFFIYRGWCYKRIANWLRNYEMGDPVYKGHKRSGELIGYALRRYSWHANEMIICWQLEGKDGS